MAVAGERKAVSRRWLLAGGKGERILERRAVAGQVDIELAVQAFILPEPLRPVTHYIRCSSLPPHARGTNGSSTRAMLWRLMSPFAVFSRRRCFANFGEQE